MIDINAWYRFIVATEKTTQSIKEFTDVYNSMKNRYNPIIWFFMELFS